MWLAGLHARPWPAASTLSGGRGGRLTDGSLAWQPALDQPASLSLSLSLSLCWCCSLCCGFPVPAERERERETERREGGERERQRDREEERWGKGAGIGKGSGCKPTQPQHTHMHTHTVFSTHASLVGGEGLLCCTVFACSGLELFFTSQTHSRGSAAKRWHPCCWNQGGREPRHL